MAKGQQVKQSIWIFIALAGLVSQVTAAVRPNVDLIVQGDYVVTMNSENEIITHGAVVIDAGRIIEVGKAVDVQQHYNAKATITGEQRVVMPGLINGHSHAAMTLLRGIADDLPLYQWLNDYIFPAEVAFADPEFVRVGTQLACWEMTRGGTTTFVDMYYHSAVIAEVVNDCGMRALVSATVIDQKSPDSEGAADSLKNARAFVQQYQGKYERVVPIFGPHANYTLNAEQLKQTRAAADALNAPISIHMAESRFEMDYSRENYQQGSVTMFDGIGFLDGPTIAAHMVWPDDDEIAILAEKQVGAIYNPTSNMKTAAGIAPVPKMLEAGVNVGLGTDGSASNNDLDMWEEMRIGAFLQKVNGMDPELLSATEMLAMATINGAKAIGLADRIGSLETGKYADLIQVSLADVHHLPIFDVISHLVYVTDEQDVVTVIINGSLLMRERELLLIDQATVRKEAAAIAARIKAKLRINVSEPRSAQ